MFLGRIRGSFIPSLIGLTFKLDRHFGFQLMVYGKLRHPTPHKTQWKIFTKK